MTKKAQKKENKEHQKALKPLMTHLKSDEKKIGKETKIMKKKK
jgi:hypothetical protein